MADVFTAVGQFYLKMFVFTCSRRVPVCESFLLFQTLDKRKVLSSQRTFDREGERCMFLVKLLTLSSSVPDFFLNFLSLNHISEEELYQNYQEKALHNDSDEDADSRGPKPDDGIVVQYRPLRASWSQLSVVRHDTHKHTQRCRASFLSLPCLFSPCHAHNHSAVDMGVFGNSRSLSRAAITSLAILPYPFSSAPHAGNQGVNSFQDSSRLGGRQTASWSHRKSWEPHWA